jgi:hypothetical protein
MLSPNLSVFVEYDYLNFGTASVNFTFPAGSIPPVNTFQIAVVVQFEFWRRQRKKVRRISCHIQTVPLPRSLNTSRRSLPVSTFGSILAVRRLLRDTDPAGCATQLHLPPV